MARLRRDVIVEGDARLAERDPDAITRARHRIETRGW